MPAGTGPGPNRILEHHRTVRRCTDLGRTTLARRAARTAEQREYTAVNRNLRGTALRLAIFLTVCGLALFVIMAVFGQVRFNNDLNAYNAEFTNVSGLREGNLVRVAGVEVGKVQSITVNDDATVRVVFTAEPAAVLTEGTRAEIRYDDLIGGRSPALLEGAGSTRLLKPGQTILLDRTQPALDLDSVTGGFRPLFRRCNRIRSTISAANS